MVSNIATGIFIAVFVFGLLFFLFTHEERKNKKDDEKDDEDDKKDDDKDKDDEKDDDKDKDDDSKGLEDKIKKYSEKVEEFESVSEDLKKQIKDLITLDPGYFDEWKEIINASNFLSAVNDLDDMEKDILDIFKHTINSDLFDKFTNKFYERVTIRKEIESEMEGLLV